MDLSLLKALSEADAIASSEQEVRQILLEEEYPDPKSSMEMRIFRSWKKRIACKKKCDLMG